MSPSSPPPTADTLTPAPMTTPLAPGVAGAPALAGSPAANTAATTEGLFARLWHRLMGRRAERLTERAGHMSLLAWLLILTQSATMILVFGHVELGAFVSGHAGVVSGAAASAGAGGDGLDPLSVRVMMGIALGVLLITVYAADAAVIKTLVRIPVLRRNGEGGALLEHQAFVAFIIAVEGVTFGIVLVVLEQNPAALFSSAPILPDSPLLLGALIALRVVAMCWTYLHLQIVAQPLPVQWETVTSRGREIVGGHAIERLTHMGVTNQDAATALRVFGEMSRPPVRKRTWWNGRLVRREAEYAQAAREQQERVIAALAQLNQDSPQERERERALRLSQDRAELLTQQLATLKASVPDLIGQALVRAFLALSTRGTLPDDLLEACPELADIALPIAGTKTKRLTAGRPATREPQTRVEAQRQFLQSLGLEPANAPPNRKGVWLRPADVRVLTDEGMAPDAITDLLRFKGQVRGESTRIGAGYAAPFDAVMEALSQSQQLGEAARIWWETSLYSGRNAANNAEGNTGDIGEEPDAVRPGVAGRPAAGTGTEGGRILAFNQRQ